MSRVASSNGGGPDDQVQNATVLVTGAAGFIGSHLCERLLDTGHAVWGLDNFDDFYTPSVKRRNVRKAMSHRAMHLVEGDIRDQILLDGLMSDVDFDAVIHLAARPGVRASIEKPELCYDVNVRGTLTVLEAMRRHGVDVLLFGSSSSVYGESEEAPFREDAAADRPISPYAATKRSGELLCHSHHHIHDLTVYCLRFFTVFGPRQRPDLAIHKFARLMMQGERLPLYGDGSSRRDYTYVDDIVDGVVLSLERASGRDGAGPEFQVVNLGRSETVTLRELVDALGEAMGMEPEVEHLPEQPGDVSATYADVERGRELLGYEPTTSLREGLAIFAKWLREEADVGTRVAASAEDSPDPEATGGQPPTDRR